MPIWNAPGSVPTPLFRLSGANMQLTTDQPFIRLGPFNTYFVTGIVARQKSGGATVACAGGVYDTAAKGGNALVAATQSWVTLASGVIVSAALAALTVTTLLSNTAILSLTTGSTAACTADLFVFGFSLD